MRIVVCVKQVYDPKTVKISRSREELICATRSRYSIHPTSTRWRRRCACARQPVAR